MSTFSDLAAEYLTGFGFTITSDQIPAVETIKLDWDQIVAWYRSLDERTKRILEWSDLAEGLKNEGLISNWPALYDLFKQNPYGGWGFCFDNIETAVNRAYHAANERLAEQYHPDSI